MRLSPAPGDPPDPDAPPVVLLSRFTPPSDSAPRYPIGTPPSELNTIAGLPCNVRRSDCPAIASREGGRRGSAGQNAPSSCILTCYLLSMRAMHPFESRSSGRSLRTPSSAQGTTRPAACRPLGCATTTRSTTMVANLAYRNRVYAAKATETHATPPRIATALSRNTNRFSSSSGCKNAANPCYLRAAADCRRGPMDIKILVEAVNDGRNDTVASPGLSGYLTCRTLQCRLSSML